MITERGRAAADAAKAQGEVQNFPVVGVEMLAMGWFKEDGEVANET